MGAFQITPKTPYGGAGDGGRQPVNGEAFTTVPSFESLLAKLDFERYDALYTVDNSYQVTAYRVLWFGLSDVCRTITHNESIGNGAVVTVFWADDTPVGDERMLGRHEGTRVTLGRLVDAGLLPESDAELMLQRRAEEWAEEGREMHFGPKAAIADAPDSSRLQKVYRALRST